MPVGLLLTLTYGVTIAGAVIALVLDALDRRAAAVFTVGIVLGVGAGAGLYAGVTHSAGTAFGPIGIGGAASMVYGVVALVGAASVLGGSDALKARRHGGSHASLIALGAAAGGAAAAALDLTTLLLLLETMALAGYALVAGSGDSRSGEAAMKYFVQGAVATGLYVFGMAVLVGFYAPTGDYLALSTSLAATPYPLPALVGAVLVLCALLFKVGGVPFHSWAPDAYETAPAESAAFLASGPKLAAIGAMGVLVTVVSSGESLRPLLLLVAAAAMLSILVGSIAALRQANLRRLLGYAGIAQTGYALLAVAIPMASLAVFYAATYAVAAVGTFLAAAAFERLDPEWDGTVLGLAGMGRRAPVLSASLSVLLVSLAGIPPLMGFWAKLVLFATGLSAGWGSLGANPMHAWSLLTGVSIAILGSVISLGYYGGILRSLYFGERASDSEAGSGRRGGPAAIGVAVIALVVIGLSVLPFALGPTWIFELFVSAS